MRRLVIFVLIVILASCSTDPSQEGDTDDALDIYTSIYPIQYVSEQIAGEAANVTSIYPPGVDAHTYEPATKEVTAIADADALFYLGAGMERFAETMKQSLESQDIAFVSIEEKNPDLFKTGHEEDGHHHSDFDPHIWLDPLRMIKIGEIVKDELIEQSPKNEQAFQARFDVFKNDMQELDADFKNTIEANNDKQILVSHAAYGYWEERYGIEQIAISGISSSEEPSQKELTEITELANEKQLHYVIFESNSSNKIASIIQDHLGADRLTIHNLEVLTDEDLANNEDYVSLMRKNLDVLDQATK